MMRREIGQAAGKSARHTWVQTERSAHEAWAQLIATAPMAARVAHTLVALMNSQGAVVISQNTLGEILAEPGKKPVHRNTIRRALQRLTDEHWIEAIELGGGRGNVLAYVVNSRVAWADKRENLRLARFSAQVVASSSEQSSVIGNLPPLRQLPIILRGEQQLPDGSGGNDLPDLPAILRDDRGREWAVDRATGELIRRGDDDDNT